jgi:hypothetical protein
MLWCLAVAMALLPAAAVLAADYAAPTTSPTKAQGASDGREIGPWALAQVWPDKVDAFASYQPMVAAGGRWVAKANGHGNAPSAWADKGGIHVISEGAWGGNPGQKLAALVFTAPATGVYELTGKIAAKRTSGDATSYVALMLFGADGKGRQIRSWRFRRAEPEPSEVSVGMFLHEGERLAFVPRLGDNNKAGYTYGQLSVKHTAASAAPDGFVENVRPSPPRPPAKDDKTPQIVVEGEQIEFPADANIINVKAEPFGAKGDGVTDDTDALNRAIARGGIIYLPNGVYLVSDQLHYSAGARVPSRTTLQGQSVKGTIVKLRDRTPDFTDPRSPYAVVWTSHFPPQAFQIHVRNLTVHTGVGNDGAIGVQFYANNQGSIEDVRVQSGDGSGVIGLDLGFDNDQGPMLARNIQVEGFDTGVRCARQTTVTTLENISVRGQKKVGFLNDMHCVAMRGFTSRNACVALAARDSAAYTAVIDSRIEGADGNAAPAAIANEGGMFLRNVKVAGYKLAMQNKAAKDGQDLAELPAEWTSHPVARLWDDSPTTSLNLPIKDAPQVPWGPLDTWVSAKAAGPTVKETGAVSRGQKVTYQEWSDSIRKAFEAGKPTVYFPKGNYIVEGEIRVPAHVRRIIGLGSTFDRDRGKVTFVVEDGDQPLRFDRWDWNYSHVRILHKGKRPVVIANTLGSHYEPLAGAGDVYFDDCCQGGLEFVKGQHVYMRQFNPEYGDKPKLINSGADLWILGIKTEGYSTMIVTRDGGRTEIIGGMAYANQGHDPEALFINFAPSSFSCSIGEWVLRSQRFEDLLVEQRGDRVKALRYDQVPPRGQEPNGKPLGGYGTSFMVPLMVGANEGGSK